MNAVCDMEMKAEREDNFMKAEREEESSSSKRCMEGGSHYYLARQTLLNMLTDRGYVVPDPSLAVVDPCTPRLIAHRASDFSRKIVAIFCEAHQTKKQDALAILSQIVNKEMLDKVILIMPSKMSFHAQKVLDAYPVQVETFMIFDLLKPKLEILSRDDKDKLLMDEQTIEKERKAKREEESRKRQSTKAERDERRRQKVMEKRRSRYYFARRTLMEMFSDRGYVVPDMDAELGLSLADFHAAFGDHPKASGLSLTAHRASDSSRKIVAVFCEDYQTKKEGAIGILSEMAKKELMVERVILVMQREMNSDAQKVLDESPVKVETFMITELQINTTRRLLEPQFEIFSHENKDKLLKDVKKFKPLPESAAWPKYYGLEKGQGLKMSYNISGWKGIFGHPIPTERVVNYFCIV